MPVYYTLDDIRDAFDDGAWRRGFDYAREGRVFSLDRGKDGALNALVEGSGVKPYRVRAMPITGPGRRTAFSTSCTCPVAIDCKHAVAALVHGVSMQPEPQVQAVTPDYGDGVVGGHYRAAPKPQGAAS